MNSSINVINEKIIQRMQKLRYINELNEMLISCNALIAGGFLLSTYDDTKVNDMDIYINTSNVDEALKYILFKMDYSVQLNSVYLTPPYCESFMKKNNVVARFPFMHNECNYGTMNPSTPVIDLTSVVEKFDFSFCKVYYNGNEVFTRYPDDIINKQGHVSEEYIEYINTNTYSNCRYKKYIAKGYKFTNYKNEDYEYDGEEQFCNVFFYNSMAADFNMNYTRDSAECIPLGEYVTKKIFDVLVKNEDNITYNLCKRYNIHHEIYNNIKNLKDCYGVILFSKLKYINDFKTLERKLKEFGINTDEEFYLTCLQKYTDIYLKMIEDGDYKWGSSGIEQMFTKIANVIGLNKNIADIRRKLIKYYRKYMIYISGYDTITYDESAFNLKCDDEIQQIKDLIGNNMLLLIPIHDGIVNPDIMICLDSRTFYKKSYSEYDGRSYLASYTRIGDDEVGYYDIESKKLKYENNFTCNVSS